MKKVAIIGSGFSSLTAAIDLAAKGFDVVVYEKNDTIGGRARKLEGEGFTFDMGPSWYWMADVFDDFFSKHHKNTSDYFQLSKLDPGFSIYFNKDDKLDVPSSFEELKNTFENIEKGSAVKLEKFMKSAKVKYDIGVKDLVYKPSNSIFEFINLKVLLGLFYLNIFSSFSTYVRRYFKDHKLIQLMEFPILFLGAIPENTPALYSLMNYTGLVDGTFYPKGGFYSVVEGLEKLAIEKGVKFHTEATVSKINIKNSRAYSILVNDKEFFYDAIVAGADYHHVEQELLDEKYRNYSLKYWSSRKLAPSSLLFYLGINKKLKNIDHHTLFFDQDFKLHANEIYEDPKWPTNPLFYMSCSSLTDPKTAPDGMENIVLLIPLAPGIDDSNDIREKYLSLILDRFRILTGNDITENIIFKKSFCVNDFKSDYNAYKGNAYGLANTLRQTAILKPKMRNRKVKNLFYTGQLTVPGPGVPPSVISGQIVAKEINKYFYN
jgi:phytoene desaturase